MQRHHPSKQALHLCTTMKLPFVDRHKTSPLLRNSPIQFIPFQINTHHLFSRLQISTASYITNGFLITTFPEDKNRSHSKPGITEMLWMHPLACWLCFIMRVLGCKSLQKTLFLISLRKAPYCRHFHCILQRSRFGHPVVCEYLNHPNLYHLHTLSLTLVFNDSLFLIHAIQRSVYYIWDRQYDSRHCIVVWSPSTLFGKCAIIL